MVSLKYFIQGLEGQADVDSDEPIVTSSFGLSVAAVDGRRVPRKYNLEALVGSASHMLPGNHFLGNSNSKN